MQLFAAGQEYNFKWSGQTPDVQVQFIVPFVGLRTRIDLYHIFGIVGPQFRRRKDDQLSGRGPKTNHEAGASVQGEAIRW